MKTKHPSLPWEVMDVRAMKFKTTTLDIAIDKGTLDVMLYGSLWDPEDEVKTNVKFYVDEVNAIVCQSDWKLMLFRFRSLECSSPEEYGCT